MFPVRSPSYAARARLNVLSHDIKDEVSVSWLMIILQCGRDQCRLNAHSVDPHSMRIEPGPVWTGLKLRRVGTSASIRFEAASISFALHATFPGSGSKVDRFDPHSVGGLKSIQVDSMNVVGGVGSNCVFPATSI